MMHLIATNTTDEGFARRCIAAIARLIGSEGAASRRASRRMALIETLPLGAKKQLLLVMCDGERFLVGTGLENVQSILQVRGEFDAAREAV